MEKQSKSLEDGVPERLSASRRERELRRYGEAVLALRSSKGSKTAKSSIDVPLTAFAQLVALRLGAKRALISLFDKKAQYILAEATQTLSLQQDYVHDKGDALHYGSAILPRTEDFSGELLQLARKSKTDDGLCGKKAALVISDLAAHARYSTHVQVVNAPFARCFAGVPLFTPSGFALGTVSILDDKPRPEGLSEPQIAFLRDVSTTIMTHLEMARVQTTHERGLRMVTGLSRFMEGKSTVADDRTPSDEDPTAADSTHASENASLGASSRTQALNHASNQERMSDARERFFEQSQAYSHNAPAGLPTQIIIPPCTRSSSLAAVTKVRRRKLFTRHSVQPRGRLGTSSQLQEDIVSQDVEHAFQRAAMIIQESMDMAGVLFLDASIGEFGSMRTDSGQSSDASDYDSVTAMEGEETANSANSHPLRLKPCRYLATSYQEGEDENYEPSHRTIPEKFLRGLMKRYPHGKIYNFGDDGVLSSDEQSDASSPTTEHRKRAWSDSVKILSIFPGVRSLAVMPLWDATRGRFFAATVAWSYNRTRLFTFQDDMNYLACCCDVVMAEVGRLDIQADVHAKTSFISSVSHELRSPLQGILGGVECLQEEIHNNDPSSRQQMVQMIDTCGRGLLDIINNLLEHAHSSSSGKTQRPGAHRRRGNAGDTAQQPVHDLAVLAEEVLDSALWSTPRPSALSTSKDDPAAPLAEDPSLRVILDVDIRNLPPTGWNVHVNSGAFRRILQNLTMNAIKYTDAGGYFKVTLSMDKGSSMIKISCTDSGRGMSEEFLKYGLWQAFKQEDSHTPGTGLGLSLVRSLVHEMGGTISLKSAKDVGTTIKLALPLQAGAPADTHNLSGLSEAAQIKGLTFTLVGFETTSEVARLAEATEIQRSSIEKVCRYLGMQPFEEHNGKTADILVITERAARRLVEDKKTSEETSGSRVCLIFCDSVTASRAARQLCASSLGPAMTVAQPLGPKQLLKALIFCLDNREKIPISAEKPTSPAVRVQTNGNHAALTPEKLVKRYAPSSGAVKVSASIEIAVRPVAPESGLITDSSVLLVDDNPINLTLLRRCIKRLGRIDLAAVNGQEALLVYKESHSHRLEHVRTSSDGKSTRTAPVRFILTDITMPVMDGLEFTRRVRAHERALDLKPAMIVALTALASSADRHEAYGSGVDLFLTKPFRYKDIEAMFKEWEADRKEDVGTQ